MSNWVNPDDFLCVFRLTTSQYADNFLNYGSIKFNTPQSWIDYEKTHGSGRGDIYEGTLAFCPFLDFDKTFELKKRYSTDGTSLGGARPLVQDVTGSRLLFKDQRSLNLPCFCLYILRNSLFPCPDTAGEHDLSSTIPASYFRDFCDQKTPDEISKLPSKDRPALIVIKDYKEFKNRLYKALSSIGIAETEVMIGTVLYHDFEKYGDNGWLDFNQKYPMELLLKNERFINQSEMRIIINTTKEEVLQRLKKAPIELGNMTDIVYVLNEYLYDGVGATLTATVTEQ